MTFSEYIKYQMPLYWDISQKRVSFAQLSKPMQLGVYKAYLDREGIVIDYNQKDISKIIREIEDLLDSLTLK